MADLNFKLIVVVLSFLMLGCGGGGDNTVNTATAEQPSTPTPVPTPTPTPTPVPVPTSKTIQIVVAGAGVVTTSTGETCKSSCSITTTADQIQLQAQADTGYQFNGWQQGCSGLSLCLLDLRTTTIFGVDANFKAKQFEHQLSIAGPGQVQVLMKAALATTFQPLKLCDSSCSFNAEFGSQLMLLAKPGENAVLNSWSNPCDNSNLEQCQFTVQQSVQLTAEFLLVTKPTAQTDNYVVLTNPTSSPLKNYPLQFARPFMAKEISNFPQLILNEQPLLTQADVKQRYADGSVKHAILSAVIPEIAAGQSIKLYFGNQSSGRQSLVPAMSTFLGTDYDFDAQIKAIFENGEQAQISARQMLEQGKYSYWTQGDIATTVLIVDHSAARSADFGADQHRSVRPAFYATFWPSLRKVQVRFVGEITNTEVLQPQSYQLTLSGSAKTPKILYQKAVVPHQAMSRWTKSYWLDVEVPAISLDHHLAYLSKTKMIPNFDSSRQIPESTIISQYKTWQGRSIDLYDAGLWTKAMATAGGRPELGLYPSWTVRWLYSGDWRLAEIALKQAELSGAWPYHVREGDPSRTFDAAQSISGLGRILSIQQGGRPTGWIPRLNWHESAEKDKINPVASLSSSGWKPDVPHHPDIASAQYLLTGDYYFLEQTLFSAAYTTMDNNAAAKSSTLGRGPTGSEGALYAGETRGQGWALRTRVHAASVIPDQMPEQSYFNQLTNNALIIWEGMYDVANPNTKSHPLWQFGRNTIAPKEFIYEQGKASPLGQWVHPTRKNTDYTDEYYDYTKAAGGTSPWMVHIVVLALGRAEELGFAAGPMKAFVGRTFTDPAGEPDFALELLSAYRQPSIKQPDGKWFDNWMDIQNAYLPEYKAETIARYQIDTYLDSEFGYNALVWGTASYLTDLKHGDKVWQFYHQRLKHRTSFDSNPKWAMLPR